MGPSLATEVILRSALNRDFELIHLDTSDHRDMKYLSKFDYKNVTLAFKHYIKLAHLIFTKHPTLVYIPLSQTTMGYLRDAPFILISKIFRRKVICHLRGGYFRNWYESLNPVMQWVVLQVHSFVDGQIVLGEKLRYLFRDILPEDRIFVVPNGRNFDSVSFRRSKKGGLRILYLAHLIRTKGILDVLSAVPDVYSKHQNVEFVFAGSTMDPRDKRDIDAFLFTNKGLPIQFTGPVHDEDKYRLYQTSDIFVFPTYYPMEGHPWVIIEAMASGLPIITTDHAAISESVENGVNGIFVEKQNPRQIAEKIIYLIENADIRRKMGENSRRMYFDKFTEERMVGRMRDAFTSVLSK